MDREGKMARDGATTSPIQRNAVFGVVMGFIVEPKSKTPDRTIMGLQSEMVPMAWSSGTPGIQSKTPRMMTNS